MEYYNKMLCVTREELIGGDDPVMKQGTLNTNIYRKNILSVDVGGGEGNYTLYSFDSMPKKYRDKFVQKYGDPAEVIRERELSKSVKYDSEAREWFELYTYYNKGNGEETTLDKELIQEYTANASVMNELLKMKTERKAMLSSLNLRATDMWRMVLEKSESLRERYHHTLPASETRLKARIRAYEKEGYESIVSKKLGNKKTLKKTDDSKKLIIGLKRSQTPRYTDEQIFDKFNAAALFRGLKPLKSLRTLKLWLESPEIKPLWYDAVFGEQAARQKYGRKQKTVLPKRRDSLWYGDGTKLNLYYQDDEGKVRTTSVYEVVDTMSEVLLGYYISDHEDYEAQYHAYRMAIQRSGHKPYEIVHDNQGGHNKLERKGKKNKHEEGFFDKICHIHRSTMPYNGQSKTIENIFGQFQQQVLSQYFFFTGQNVTAKKDTSKPNMEMIAANKDKLPTYRELCNIYAECREQWNEMQHSKKAGKRIELYESSVNEDTPVVGKYEMQDMFWIMSDKPVTFTDQGIKMTIDKQPYQWEVFTEDETGKMIPDREWRKKHTWEQFYVQYDPADKTTVNLYSIDKAGKRHFCRVAQPYMEIPRALQDQTAQQKAFIHEGIERGKQDRIERVVAGRQIAINVGTDPEQNGLIYPKLRGLTAEQQAQVYARLEDLDKPRKEVAEVVELGKHTKKLSNEDWSDYISLDLRKTVGKL